jgi:hypothetical protein
MSTARVKVKGNVHLALFKHRFGFFKCRIDYRLKEFTREPDNGIGV